MRADLTRRSLLQSGAAAAAAAAYPLTGIAPPSAAATSDRPFLPYGQRSYFRTPHSGDINWRRTQAFRRFMRTHPDQRHVAYPKITGQDGNEWGTTTHVARRTDPVWRLTNPTSDTRVLATRGFHMPDDVADRIPTGTQDRPFLIVDPVFGYSLFCADVVPDRRTRSIKVSASAVFHHTSNGLDGRNRRSNDNRNSSSRGRIPDAMVIRPDLVRYGIEHDTGLGHVLQMFFVETRTASGYCHPMVGDEGGKHGWGAEGDRIAIRPGLDLRRRGLTGGALVVARTLQTHGAYLGDNSGSSSMLKGAQSTSRYKPYAGTNIGPDCLKGLTWDDFVVIRRR